MTLNVVKFTSNMNGSVPFGIGTWPACSRRDAYLDSSKGVMYPSGNGFKSIDLEKDMTASEFAEWLFIQCFQVDKFARDK
jgi:hypothetical protein